MIEQISLALINESGECVPIEKISVGLIESKLELAIADTFTEICRTNNDISDSEIKIAEKFFFALNLKKYLKEIKQNAD